MAKHVLTSPVHLPAVVLMNPENYVEPLFKELYMKVRSIMEIANMYDPSSDTIATMVAKWILWLPEAEQKNAIEQFPIDTERFRFYIKPSASSLSTKQTPEELYSQALHELYQQLLTRIFVVNGEEIPTRLKATLTETSLKDSSLALIEFQLIGLLNKLQWCYQAYFDTTPFYRDLTAKYRPYMHKELEHLLRSFATSL